MNFFGMISAVLPVLTVNGCIVIHSNLENCPPSINNAIDRTEGRILEAEIYDNSRLVCSGGGSPGNGR